MKILVLNAGSSSQKSRLYEITSDPTLTPPEPLWRADADWSKEPGKTTLSITGNGQSINEEMSTDQRPEIIEHMLKTLWSGKTQVISRPDEIAMVGHRVVHGGPDYQTSVLITQQVQETIQRLAAFAPLHNPANLEGIETARRLLSQTPQVAVFDTAFHRHLPPESTIYPGPYSWFEQGIRRYGFHGISHQYCTQRSLQLLQRDPATTRLITCHLGNGCSLAAIRNGESVETTMGFTPLEGVMMGGRSGTVDPSILLYLQREHGYTIDQLDHQLNKESGLKGVSGVSSDMRQILHAIESGNTRARLAFDIYIYRLRYFIGALIAVLGGVDVLTFAGGVGENAASVRKAVCNGLGFVNLALDHAKNASPQGDQDIATVESTVRVLVVHTEEDWEIARECWQLRSHIS